MVKEPTILILASGEPRRDWTNENPCQMAVVEGKPLILRTLSQLAMWGHDQNVFTVTHKEPIKAVVPCFFIPNPRFYWAETVLSTRLLWRNRTIILHGDVIFSPAVLHAILSDTAPIAFHLSLIHI